MKNKKPDPLCRSGTKKHALSILYLDYESANLNKYDTKVEKLFNSINIESKKKTLFPAKS